MALKLLHFGILFMFAALEITWTDAAIHVINAVTYPSPIFLRISKGKDGNYARNVILKQGEKIDLELRVWGIDIFGEFRRGEGEGAQFIKKALYPSHRDRYTDPNSKFEGEIYWKVENDGLSLSYDNISYGKKKPWTQK